jgi:AcrR family transcriptional regulator
MSAAQPPAALPLRERKKALTRAAIVEAATRLFEQRGFDNVTVAEIADAANVSVKTLFVYFRAKDELVFADNTLFDDIITALRERPAGTSHAQAIAEAVVGMARSQNDGGEGLEAFHRAYGDSTAVQAGLLRLWADFEDRLTEFLANEAAVPATARLRLHAIQQVAIVRSVISPETRAMIAATPRRRRAAALTDWLMTAAATTPAVEP